MSRLLIVVEKASDWGSYYPSENVVSAVDYLKEPLRALDTERERTQVINLCRSYKYLGLGYYVSLLAEARGHKVIPSVRTINDLRRRSLYGVDIEQVFEAFPCPILRIEFERERVWRIASIKPAGLHTLSDGQEDAFAEAMAGFSRKLWRKPRARRSYRYDMAMLHDPADTMPPSNKKALKLFIDAGKELGIDLDPITKNDFARLAEYDGLFIRETTALDNHTYRFSHRADREGMVVIDDPVSILRCTNKIYLHDLLKSRKLSIPRTEIVFRDDSKRLAALPDLIGFPIVLKIPDGSFSRGISKVETPEQLKAAAEQLFQHTALLLAQEYMYTEFDWRIGVLAGQPLYACQYFMSRGHWQIYNHAAAKGGDRVGKFKTLPVRDAPAEVVKLALRATNAIGDGLYGVDIKATKDRVVVIEVNDNPSIDAGVEDGYLGEDLYRRIMDEFLRRLERKRLGIRD